MSDELNDTGIEPGAEPQEHLDAPQQRQQQRQQPAPDAEAQARAGGWVPIDEWRGDPAKHKSAEQFLQDGERFANLMRSQRDQLKAELEETRRATQTFIEHQKKGYEREIAKLKAERKDAIVLGDPDKVDELDGRIGELNDAIKTAAPEQQEAKAREIPPERVAWGQRNPWYGRDPEETQIAQAIGTALYQSNPGITESAFLELLDARLAKRGIGVPQRRQGAAVDDGGATRAAPGSSADSKAVEGLDGVRRTYSSLPAETKTVVQDMIKRGIIRNTDEYLKYCSGE